MKGRFPQSDSSLILTCEHGGNRIPPEYGQLFRNAGATLASHRGWDRGALMLARSLGRRLGLPVHAVTWSRLVVESNRAPTNRRIWSPWTASLPTEVKKCILEHYWWPHRRTVEAAVRSVAEGGGSVIHVAVHTFTPVLDGKRRTADIGLLYDSRRSAESGICIRWAELLRERMPGLRVRRNYPYRGAADGLTTWLRRRFPEKGYIGIELEVNQACLSGQHHKDLARPLADTLAMIRSDIHRRGDAD